jgi:hypothetical protein
MMKATADPAKAPLKLTPPANQAKTANPAVMANAVRNRLLTEGNSAWCSDAKTARIAAAKPRARRSEILNERCFGSASLPADQQGWRHQSPSAHRTRERAYHKQVAQSIDCELNHS